jgi:type IV secretion system protein VirB3
MQREAIYKGATRPAMKFGVPLVPLGLLFGGGMLVTLWGGVLVSWWTAAAVFAAVVPTLAWMRFATRRDDQRFRQIFLALKLRRADRNQSFWQARSYAPYPFRGGTDAWHR